MISATLRHVLFWTAFATLITALGCNVNSPSTFALAAKRDLPALESLTLQNVELVTIPNHRLPSNAIRSLQMLDNRFAARKLPAGHVLTTSDVQDDFLEAPSTRIKEGQRVAALRVISDRYTSTLKHGDVVDVWAIPDFADNKPRSKTCPVVRNATVLAARENPTKLSYSGHVMTVQLVNLIMSPDEAKLLMFDCAGVPLFLRFRPTHNFATTKQLKAGDRLTLDNIDVFYGTEEIVPDDAITRLELLHNRVASTALGKGHILVPSDIRDFDPNNQ